MNNLTYSTYKCRNSNCPSEGVPKDLDVVIEQETGAQYLRYEDEGFCQDCLHPMEED